MPAGACACGSAANQPQPGGSGAGLKAYPARRVRHPCLATERPAARGGRRPAHTAAGDRRAAAGLAGAGRPQRARKTQRFVVARQQRRSRTQRTAPAFVQAAQQAGFELVEGGPLLALAADVKHDLHGANGLLGDLSAAESPALDAWLAERCYWKRARCRRPPAGPNLADLQARHQRRGVAAATPQFTRVRFQGTKVITYTKCPAAYRGSAGDQFPLSGLERQSLAVVDWRSLSARAGAASSAADPRRGAAYSAQHPNAVSRLRSS